MNDEKCPLCGTEITGEEFQKVKTKLNEENKKAMEAGEIALRKQFASENETNLAAFKAKFEADARKAIEAEKKQNAELVKQISELNSAQAKFKKQLGDANEEKLKVEREKMALDTKKQMDQQRKVLDDSKAKEKAEMAAEHRRHNDAMEKKLLAAQRQLEDKSASSIGDGAEINLYEELRRAFPNDRIDPIEKGKKGADIHHDVINEGISVGRIVYDSKNCQQWRESFATKLRDDQVAVDAEHAVLASTIFPKGQRELFVSNDVVVVHPARAVYVATILRKSLVELAKSCASEQDRSEKTQRLYDFIRSPQFANRLGQATKYTVELLKYEVEDKNHFDKMAKKRGAKITDIKNAVRDLELEIGQIIGGNPLAPSVNGHADTANNPAQPR